MGQRAALAGKTVLPFSIWLAAARLWRPSVLFHECTSAFDPNILRHWLPEHAVHSTHMTPVQFGWPVQRKRRYSVALRRDAFVLPAGLEPLRKFQRQCGLDCRALFTASTEAVQVAKSKAAKSRRVASTSSWLDILCPGEQVTALNLYE